MGGCQNYGPLFDPYYGTAPNILGYPKRDHNFDNHPYTNAGMYGDMMKREGVTVCFSCFFSVFWGFGLSLGGLGFGV